MMRRNSSSLVTRVSPLCQAGRRGILFAQPLRTASSHSTRLETRVQRVWQGLKKVKEGESVSRKWSGVGMVAGIAGGTTLWIKSVGRSSHIHHCDDLPQAPVESKQVDPFAPTQGRMSLYEMFKLLFGAWYLVPLRAMLIIPSLCVAYAFALLSTVGLSEEEKTKKLPQWREWAFIVPCRLITRLVLFMGGFYRIKTIGKPATIEEAPIVVSNHVSYMDPVIYASTSQLPSFVAKQSVERIPLIGHYAKIVLNCVFVDRFNEASRVQALETIKARVKDESNHHQLMIFPEGTVTNGRALISFKTGAFVPGLPVQPVCIRYPHTFFDPVFPKGVNVIFCIFRVLCQFVNHVEIIYLPVYHPSKEEIADPQLYANNVRKLMAEVLGVPTTNHTIADALREEREDVQFPSVPIPKVA